VLARIGLGSFLSTVSVSTGVGSGGGYARRGSDTPTIHVGDIDMYIPPPLEKPIT